MIPYKIVWLSAHPIHSFLSVLLKWERQRLPTGPRVCSHYRTAPVWRNFGSKAPIIYAGNAPPHPSMSQFFVVSRSNKLNEYIWWNQAVVSDKSRLNLGRDNSCVCVWRTRSKYLNPAFVLQRHITPTTVVMEWGANAYDKRSRLI